MENYLQIIPRAGPSRFGITSFKRKNQSSRTNRGTRVRLPVPGITCRATSKRAANYAALTLIHQHFSRWGFLIARAAGRNDTQKKTLRVLRGSVVKNVFTPTPPFHPPRAHAIRPRAE